MEFERRCWAEIDLNALRNNFSVVQKSANGTPVMAVVKADAYGHGDTAVCKIFDEAGAAWFAVSGFEEAMRLRRSGIQKPILILGYTGAVNAAALAENNITQTVYSLEYAYALSDAAQRADVKVNVHIKLDTGMGRIGFAVRDDMETALAEVVTTCRLPGLAATGVFTHFSVADSAAQADRDYTQEQYKLLFTSIHRLAAEDIHFNVSHCCNSAGTFYWPEYHLGMVRPGIILYGEDPSDDVHLPGISPALKLKAAVSMVKQIPAQDDVSYGRTFQSEKPMRIATLAVGYADGYPRNMSNKGIVCLHGKPARVVGRVCMDQMMIDVTDIDDVKVGDIAIVFGGYIADSVAEIARANNTVPYEILCDIGRRVPRVYIENGHEVQIADYLRGV